MRGRERAPRAAPELTAHGPAEGVARTSLSMDMSDPGDGSTTTT